MDEHLTAINKHANGHVNGYSMNANGNVNGHSKHVILEKTNLGAEWRFDTLQIHAGLDRDDKYNPCTLPIYQTAAFGHRSTSSIADAMSDLSCDQNYFYSRMCNPTQSGLEKRVAALEGCTHARAFASGCAATQAVIATLAGRGDNVVVSHSIYSGTYRQFLKAQADFGIEIRFVDVDDIELIHSSVDDRTKFIFVESLGNPMQSVPDFEELSAICHAENTRIPLVVDATLTAAGYYCQPAKWGADIILHSATKMIGGHGTTVGGIVIEAGQSDWQENMARFSFLHGKRPDLEGPQGNWYAAAGNRAYMQFLQMEYMFGSGACLSPLSCQQLFVGVETLSVRCERQARNTDIVARWLRDHPRVAWVSYLGLEDHAHHQMALKYFHRGFGSFLNFGLRGGETEAVRLIDGFRMIINATNIGDAKTIVGHQWSTTHKSYSEEKRLAMGVTADLVRLSLGLEDFRDIIADFEQSFAKV